MYPCKASVVIVGYYLFGEQTKITVLLIVTSVDVFLIRSVLAQYMNAVLTVLLRRLQEFKTDKFKKGFVNFSFFFMALDKEGTGPDAFWSYIEGIQAGLFVKMLKTIWLTEAQKISGRVERKTCAVALVRLLTGSRIITEGTNFDAAW